MKMLTVIAMLFFTAAISQPAKPATETKKPLVYAFVNVLTNVFAKDNKNFNYVGGGATIGAFPKPWLGLGTGLEVYNQAPKADINPMVPCYFEMRLMASEKKLVPFGAFQVGSIFWDNKIEAPGIYVKTNAKYFLGGNAGFYYPIRSIHQGLSFSLSYRHAVFSTNTRIANKVTITESKSNYWLIGLGIKL